MAGFAGLPVLGGRGRGCFSGRVPVFTAGGGAADVNRRRGTISLVAAGTEKGLDLAAASALGKVPFPALASG